MHINIYSITFDYIMTQLLILIAIIGSAYASAPFIVALIICLFAILLQGFKIYSLFAKVMGITFRDKRIVHEWKPEYWS